MNVHRRPQSNATRPYEGASAPCSGSAGRLLNDLLQGPSRPRIGDEDEVAASLIGAPLGDMSETADDYHRAEHDNEGWLGDELVEDE